jgi:hypothetical protein
MPFEVKGIDALIRDGKNPILLKFQIITRFSPRMKRIGAKGFQSWRHGARAMEVEYLGTCLDEF